jgi:hypothetical protein
MHVDIDRHFFTSIDIVIAIAAGTGTGTGTGAHELGSAAKRVDRYISRGCDSIACVISIL